MYFSKIPALSGRVEVARNVSVFIIENIYGYFLRKRILITKIIRLGTKPRYTKGESVAYPVCQSYYYLPTTTTTQNSAGGRAVLGRVIFGGYFTKFTKISACVLVATNFSLKKKSKNLMSKNLCESLKS